MTDRKIRFVTSFVLSLGLGGLAESNLAAQVVIVGNNNSPEVLRRHSELGANTRKLRAELTMNRDVYFPGESATLKMFVVNESYEPIETFEPFVEETSNLEFYVRSSTVVQEWLPMAPNHRHNFVPGVTPTVRIPAGFSTELTTDLRAECARIKSSGCVLPLKPGEYQLIYGIGLRAAFRIEVPAVVGLEKFDVPESARQKTSIVPGNGKFGVIRLRYRGNDFVAVTDVVSSLTLQDLGKASLLELPTVAGLTYTRVVDAEGEMQSFHCQLVSGRLKLDWTDAGGEHSRTIELPWIARPSNVHRRSWSYSPTNTPAN